MNSYNSDRSHTINIRVQKIKPSGVCEKKK